MSQPARVRFDVGDGELDDVLRAFDAAGRQLSLYDARSDLVHLKIIPYERISLRMAAESEWLLAAETEEIAVYRGGEERARLRVRLEVEELNHVVVPP